jgi:hypothetical protein
MSSGDNSTNKHEENNTYLCPTAINHFEFFSQWPFRVRGARKSDKTVACENHAQKDI